MRPSSVIVLAVVLSLWSASSNAAPIEMRNEPVSFKKEYAT